MTVPNQLGSVEIHRGIYRGRGEKDISGEALIGFVCAHGDAFEFLELAEKFSIRWRHL